MPATKLNSADILTRGLQEVFSTSYKEAESRFRSLFHVIGSTKDFEEFLGYAGFPYFSDEGEMEVVELKEALLGFKTRITPKRVGLGYQVSKELVDDEKYGWLGSLSGELGRALRATKEKHAADVLNFGFTAGATALADGKALFATDHPLRRGGTNNNTLGATDLDYQALISAALRIAQLQNDAARPMGVDGALSLIVPRINEFQGAEALRSVSRPDTANRADNVLRQLRTWTLVPWDYLDSSIVEFVVQGAKRYHKLLFINRMDSQQYTVVEEKTYSAMHIVRSRYKAGAADHRGIVAAQAA